MSPLRGLFTHGDFSSDEHPIDVIYRHILHPSPSPRQWCKYVRRTIDVQARSRERHECTQDAYRARRQVSAKSFRVFATLEGIPGELICDRCLAEEHIAALERDLVHDDLSGDGQPIE